MYPQVMPNRAKHAFGCWDYYGYSDDVDHIGQYATKEGSQMKLIHQYMTDLTNGKLKMQKVGISGPEYVESSQQCVECQAGKGKVCSVDGVAWCCEVGDESNLCNCGGGELSDLVYCPSDPNCGDTTIEFNSENGYEVSISNEKETDLCVYMFLTETAGTVEINSDEILTAFDPETLHIECLSKPCEITARLETVDEMYILSKGASELKFTAELSSPLIIQRGWQIGLLIIFIVLILIGLALTVVVVVICRRVRKTKKEVRAMHNEMEDSLDEPLNSINE